MRLIVLITLLLIALAPAAGAEDRAAEQQFFEGLRARGQYWLAQQYGLDRLAQPVLSDDERAEVVIELLRTLAEWAVASPPEQRAPLWQQAQEIGDEFLRQWPEHPRRPLVRLQAALTNLTRGELARQETEVQTGAADVDKARTHLRTAVRDLTAVADETEAILRERNRLPRPSEPAPDALSTDELQSLLQATKYQLARAYRNQAECYPAGSPDRTSAATQALELLGPLAGLDPSHPDAWRARIDEIACHRLQGDWSEATRKAASLVELGPPESIRQRAWAERILTALDAGQTSAAVALAEEFPASQGPRSAWLDDARLAAYLAAGAGAGASGIASAEVDWIAKATALSEEIETLHGPYWGRRASLRLGAHLQTAPAGASVAVFVRAAESAYRGGRLDDALELYDEARAASGDPAKAFELGFTAAAIEHRRGMHGEALRRYRELATTWPEHPRAAEAHGLALENAGQLAREQTHDPRQSITLAQEHLQLWPTGPRSHEVRWLLGRLHEYQRAWPEAVAAYASLPPGAAEYPRALPRIHHCYRRWLEDRRQAGEPTEALAAQAVTWFEQQAFPGGQPPSTWNTASLSAVLAAAELQLNYLPSGSARAEELLSAALQGAPDAPNAWRTSAEALLVVALAGVGRRDEAAALLTRLSTASPEQLLELLEGLNRVAASAPSALRSDLAELQLEAVRRLEAQREALSAAAQTLLDRIGPAALAASGQTEQSLIAYQRAAQAHPRDGDLQEAYARALQAQVDRGSREAALAQWRSIAAKSPRASPRFFRAKYEVARLHRELGDPQAARTIVRQLQVLYPDMGGPELKTRFETLLAEMPPANAHTGSAGADPTQE